jgi:hypothetical protein
MYTLEGTGSSDKMGQPSCLWVSGNIVYALVVIMANTKIAYQTNTHTIMSSLLIFLSIMSFFVVYGIENLFEYFPNLYLTWTMMMTIPSFYVLILFFIIFVLICEIIIYWTSTWYEQKKE